MSFHGGCAFLVSCVFLIFKRQVDIVFARATVPLSLAGHRTTNLPAVGVRNRKGQASIRVRIWRLVHPLPTITRRTYIHRRVIGQITHEVHRFNSFSVHLPPGTHSRRLRIATASWQTEGPATMLAMPCPRGPARRACDLRPGRADVVVSAWTRRFDGDQVRASSTLNAWSRSRMERGLAGPWWAAWRATWNAIPSEPRTVTSVLATTIRSVASARTRQSSAGATPTPCSVQCRSTITSLSP